MNPVAALLVALAVTGIYVSTKSTRAPSRVLLASPTTVWPATAVTAAIGAAVVGGLVAEGLGAGVGIAVLVALALGFVAMRPRRNMQQTRIVYERGATVLLRAELVTAMLVFGVIWAVLAR
jgi:uncharacterized protein YcfJ